MHCFLLYLHIKKKKRKNLSSFLYKPHSKYITHSFPFPRLQLYQIIATSLPENKKKNTHQPIKINHNSFENYATSNVNNNTINCQTVITVVNRLHECMHNIYTRRRIFSPAGAGKNDTDYARNPTNARPGRVAGSARPITLPSAFLSLIRFVYARIGRRFDIWTGAPLAMQLADRGRLLAPLGPRYRVNATVATWFIARVIKELTVRACAGRFLRESLAITANFMGIIGEVVTVGLFGRSG